MVPIAILAILTLWPRGLWPSAAFVMFTVISNAIFYYVLPSSDPRTDGLGAHSVIMLVVWGVLIFARSRWAARRR